MTATWRLMGVFCLLGLWPADAHAEGFVFNIDNPTLKPGTVNALIQQFYPALASQSATLAPQLESQLNPALQQVVANLRQNVATHLAPLDFSSFVQHSATAAAMSGKSITADYASWVHVASLSLGVTGALSGFDNVGALLNSPQSLADDLANGKAPTTGVAPGGAITLGVSLAPFGLKPRGLFDPSRMTLYASFLMFSLNINGGETLASSRNFGLYGKYQLFKQRALTNNSLVRWGGLNVMTGLGYARQKIDFRTDLPASDFALSQNFQGQKINVTAAWSGSAEIGSLGQVYTLPIEVGSSIELLYAFTLYGGAAVDFNFGSSRLIAKAHAPVVISAANEGSTKRLVLLEPTPTLSYEVERKPTVSDVRAFVGLQLGAGAAGVFVQAAIDSSETVAGSAGLRLFW